MALSGIRRKNGKRKVEELQKSNSIKTKAACDGVFLKFDVKNDNTEPATSEPFSACLTECPDRDIFRLCTTRAPFYANYYPCQGGGDPAMKLFKQDIRTTPIVAALWILPRIRTRW